MDCQNCGEHFALYRNTQRFCSPQCRKQNYRIAWRRSKRHGFSSPQAEYNFNNPEKFLLKNAKARAKLKGLVFDLKLEDIYIPDLCPILKLPLVKGTRTAPSLDRINSDEGYVKGNVRVISYIANMMKHNASIDELKRFGEWIKTL